MGKTTSGNVMERIVALCKRRGFIFQSSEIYGGISGFWDYGPLGVELKRNLKNAWWYDMVHAREDMVGLDCSIIMHPQVWKCSGHYDLFHDMMQSCRQCKKLFRVDHLATAYLRPWDADIPDGEVDLADVNDRAASSSYTLSFVAQDIETCTPLIKQVLGSRKVSWHYVAVMPAQIQVGPAPTGRTLAFVAAGKSNYFVDMSRPGEAKTCPECGGDLTEPREFNLMFETYYGALRNEDNKAFLRPETAQGIFVNFKNVVDSTRVKIPFGIAQIGKSFRNEITPRNYTFRSREFEQMEIEFFCHPDESEQWYKYWRDKRMEWYISLGLASSKLQLREHDKEELSHYSRGTADIEYAFPFLAEGEFGELEGIAHRGDFDLRSHMEGKLDPSTNPLELEKDANGKPVYKGSGKDLTYFDPQKNERFTPHVIEPSAGADRGVLAFICEAYTVDESRPSPELMKFHPRLAPIKAAVFPLVAKDGMPEIAEPLYKDIRKRWPAQYDAKQSIGKRYARMDEAGTPYCFTIDGQTKEDGTVTVRDRDTGHQDRIDKSRVVEYLAEKLGEI